MKDVFGGIFRALEWAWEGIKKLANLIGMGADLAMAFEDAKAQSVTKRGGASLLDIGNPEFYGDVSKLYRENRKAREDAERVTQGEVDSALSSGKRRKPPFASEQTYNYVTIHVDLKSDDSPEAIAVKVERAWERITRTPVSSRRAPLLQPLPAMP